MTRSEVPHEPSPAPRLTARVAEARTATTRAAVLLAIGVWSSCVGSALAAPIAAPPRYLAVPVPGRQHLCTPSNPQSVAPIHGTALADDGRVAGVADCGSTVGGSRPFVTYPDGTVLDIPHGDFDFATPAGFLSDGRVLLAGDECPPLNGACTTSIATAAPYWSQPVVLGTSSVAAPSVIETQDTGWAVGWGPIVASDAWRLRADGTLEALAVPKGSGLMPTGISRSGVVSGNAWIGGTVRAVRWNAAGVATVLASLVEGEPASAEAIGDDGSAVGTSGGRAVWWMANSSSATPLMPAGSASVALRMAGNPAAANPLGFAIFGSHVNGTRVFRANGPLAWSDLGPIDASAQFSDFAILAAPRPDFMIATARTPLYQRVPFVWQLGDALRRLESVIVNPIATVPGAPLEVVDANAMGTVLVNAGPSLAPYWLLRLASGDTDGDGLVNAADLAALLDAWGAVPAGRRAAEDFDGDQVVGPSDLATLLAAWS